LKTANLRPAERSLYPALLMLGLDAEIACELLISDDSMSNQAIVTLVSPRKRPILQPRDQVPYTTRSEVEVGIETGAA